MCVLQWGHGESAVENSSQSTQRSSSHSNFNGATANPPWKTLLLARKEWRAWKLQWGHGESAVENGTLLCRRRAGRCDFNGATANPPWKTKWDRRASSSAQV